MSPLLAQLSEKNPDHHLWKNNGVWFMHYTHYPTPHTKERVRLSLKTHDLDAARLLRDQELLRAAQAKVLAPLYTHARRRKPAPALS